MVHVYNLRSSDPGTLRNWSCNVRMSSQVEFEIKFCVRIDLEFAVFLNFLGRSNKKQIHV